MVREKMKQKSGKYFLEKRTRYVSEYYHESGRQDVGTQDERDYCNWTRYRDEARSFQTVKEAQSMARMLWEKYGASVVVVNHYGAVV